MRPGTTITLFIIAVVLGSVAACDDQGYIGEWDDTGIPDYLPLTPLEPDFILGGPAPKFALPRLVAGEATEDTVRLAQYRGHVVVLNFWYTGCPACIPEKPILNRVAEKYSEAGVVFLGINPGDPAEHFLEFERRYGHSLYPQLQDSGNEVAESFDLRGHPLHVVIDRDGNIAWWRPGGPIAEDVLVDVVEDVIAGRRPTAPTSAAYGSD